MNATKRMTRLWRIAALVIGAALGAAAADAANTVTSARDSSIATMANREDGDQLAQVRQMMVLAQRQLAGYKIGPEQIQLQQQIVRRLEELLRDDGVSSSGSQAGGAAGAGGNTRPPSTPSGPSGAGPAPDTPRAMADAVGQGEGVMPRLWGRLPPESQRQLESAFPQRFLPAYEQQIRAYYRRLAEEQGLGGP